MMYWNIRGSFLTRLGVEYLTVTLRVLVVEGIPGHLAPWAWTYNCLDYPQLIWADRAGGFLIQHKSHLF